MSRWASAIRESRGKNLPVIQGLDIPVRDDAVRRAQRGEKLAFIGRSGKSRLLLDVAASLGPSVVVRVAAGPDQLEHLLLTAASRCGGPAMRAVASSLQASVAAAVKELKMQLGARALLVDDLDALGTKGFDHELRHALHRDIEIVRQFVVESAQVVTVSEQSEQVRAREPVVLKPTSEDPMWAKVGGDLDLFELASLREQIAMPEPDSTSWDPADIVRDIWSALPDELRDLVGLLAVHGRALPRVDFEGLALVARRTLDAAVDGQVILEEAGMLRLPKPWYTHCPTPDRQSARLKLAEAFAAHAIGEDAVLSKPLFVLEAHRHFAMLEDLDRAREFAKFGAATLLETACCLSLRGRADRSCFGRAASFYDAVLQLNDAVNARGDALPDRVVGYATHYKHYNRYRAHVESPADTIRGYRRALISWPENALFHSRLIGALMVEDRYPEAEQAIQTAHRVVPPHPQRESVLRARTSAKLLKRERYEAALLVWDGHRPTGLDGYTASAISSALEEWQTGRLRDFSQQLVFTEPVTIRFSQRAEGWTVVALDLAGHGVSPAAAYSDLIVTVRARVTHLHRSLTHTLSAVDRMEKQRLLGLVDLAASGLLDLGAGTTWVYGRLTGTPDGLAFATHDGFVLPLDATLAQTHAEESSYRLARVKTGDAGEPVGPVLELEAPLGGDSTLVLARWRERLASDG